jgi:hypothetical protein
LAEYLIGWVSGALESLFKAITGFFSWLGQQIWNGILWVADQILGFIEWILNFARSILPYVLTITLAWWNTYYTLKNPNLSFRVKALRTLGGAILSPILAYIFDSIVPKSVRLPRFASIPRVAPVPPLLVETVKHDIKTEESVRLIDWLKVRETSTQNITSTDKVVIKQKLVVSESVSHNQQTFESVILT